MGQYEARDSTAGNQERLGQTLWHGAMDVDMEMQTVLVPYPMQYNAIQCNAAAMTIKPRVNCSLLILSFLDLQGGEWI
jgi:hypothetical protein